MKIVLTQEVGAPGARDESRTLVRLEFEVDGEFPGLKFANDDNIQLLDGYTIKLTACYQNNKNLVVAILRDIETIFSAVCLWDEVNPVFTIRIKDDCIVRVICEK